MMEPIWGNHQVAFFQDGSTSTTSDSKVAMGLINHQKKPSTVYLFGYELPKISLSRILGKHGVTTESEVINNTTQSILGNVSALLITTDTK